MGKPQSLYLSEEAIEAIEAAAAVNDRSKSWAADKLILRGASIVKVPAVAGGIEGWRAMVDLEKGAGE